MGTIHHHNIETHNMSSLKKSFLLMFFLVQLTWLNAQSANEKNNLDEKYLEKVASIDAAIETLYAVISGEKGEVRNWELLKYLFHPNAQMIASGKNREGKTVARYTSPDGYIDRSGKWLVDNGFFEEELHRTTEHFGHIAHVFSTYQTFRSKKETKPFMRGINSIQLLYDGNRWWVINIFWTQETTDNPIPKKYLPKK